MKETFFLLKKKAAELGRTERGLDILSKLNEKILIKEAFNDMKSIIKHDTATKELVSNIDKVFKKNIFNTFCFNFSYNIIYTNLGTLVKKLDLRNFNIINNYFRVYRNIVRREKAIEIIINTISKCLICNVKYSFDCLQSISTSIYLDENISNAVNLIQNRYNRELFENIKSSKIGRAHV